MKSNQIRFHQALSGSITRPLALLPDEFNALRVFFLLLPLFSEFIYSVEAFVFFFFLSVIVQSFIMVMLVLVLVLGVITRLLCMPVYMPMPACGCGVLCLCLLY